MGWAISLSWNILERKFEESAECDDISCDTKKKEKGKKGFYSLSLSHR